MTEASLSNDLEDEHMPPKGTLRQTMLRILNNFGHMIAGGLEDVLNKSTVDRRLQQGIISFV